MQRDSLSKLKKQPAWHVVRPVRKVRHVEIPASLSPTNVTSLRDVLVMDRTLPTLAETDVTCLWDDFDYKLECLLHDMPK